MHNTSERNPLEGTTPSLAIEARVGRKPTGNPIGRPPKDEGERYLRILISLAPETIDTLTDLIPEDGTRSGFISDLIHAEARRAAKRKRR